MSVIIKESLALSINTENVYTVWYIKKKSIL